MRTIPYLVQADGHGQIREYKSLHMLINRCGHWSVPQPGDLIELPQESELFLLPGRHAVGLEPKERKVRRGIGLAVGAFAAPGYTLTGHPAYIQDSDAPMLPLFAYGAVGFSHGKFFIAASKVDDDPRQRFSHIKDKRIEREAAHLLAIYPNNRLVAHIINNCVRRYACPAARNFALGRYEAPLPTSRSCPANCIGCISHQDKNSPIGVTPQCRMNFTPNADEIVEVMQIHSSREKNVPIFSFGQGCEGDPLVNSQLLCEAVARFRQNNGHGTVNCNTNAYDPAAIAALAQCGLTSLRVSLNSAQISLYTAYYRPQGYDFASVRESMRVARWADIFVSLNLLYFPGVTDTAEEIAALSTLCSQCGVAMIQLRNLNIDPAFYPTFLKYAPENAAVGIRTFIRKMQTACPWLRFGYFNPYLGDKAQIKAPMPS